MTSTKESALRSLSAAIKRRRLALGMTQEDLAFAAGLSVRHYQSLESGVLNPSYLVLKAVASALGVGISPLIAELEPPQVAPKGVRRRAPRPRREQ